MCCDTLRYIMMCVDIVTFIYNFDDNVMCEYI